MTQHMVRVNFKLTQLTHAKLKIWCAKHAKSAQGAIRALVEEAVAGEVYDLPFDPASDYAMWVTEGHGHKVAVERTLAACLAHGIEWTPPSDLI
jgi:plasmid stability protein